MLLDTLSERLFDARLSVIEAASSKVEVGPNGGQRVLQVVHDERGQP